MAVSNRITEKIATLCIFIFGMLIGTSYAQDRVIPGRIVVEFDPGVIAIPKGNIKVPPNSSSVLVPSVLVALESIKSVEVEKLFPSAITGRTEVLSPITHRLVHIKDL